jgi:hypothetical protein
MLRCKLRTSICLKAASQAILKCYLMVQLVHDAYFLGERPHRASPQMVGE